MYLQGICQQRTPPRSLWGLLHPPRPAVLTAAPVGPSDSTPGPAPLPPCATSGLGPGHHRAVKPHVSAVAPATSTDPKDGSRGLSWRFFKGGIAKERLLQSEPLVPPERLFIIPPRGLFPKLRRLHVELEKGSQPAGGPRKPPWPSARTRSPRVRDVSE